MRSLKIESAGITSPRTLAVIAMAAFVGAGCARQAVVESDPRDRGGADEQAGADLASTATLENDLEELAAAQEAEYEAEGRYASNLADLGFAPSPGVEIEILQGDQNGFSAIGTAGESECAIYSGDVRAPRTYVMQEGTVACRS